jgi:hypothetical protein
LGNEVFQQIIDPIRHVAFAWPRPEQELKPFVARAHDAGCKVTFMAGGVPEAVRAAEAGWGAGNRSPTSRRKATCGRP